MHLRVLTSCDFVLKNQFEDRGANFFGDEGILAQWMRKVVAEELQVNIRGALCNLEQEIADDLVKQLSASTTSRDSKQQ